MTSVIIVVVVVMMSMLLLLLLFIVMIGMMQTLASTGKETKRDIRINLVTGPRNV